TAVDRDQEVELAHKFDELPKAGLPARSDGRLGHTPNDLFLELHLAFGASGDHTRSGRGLKVSRHLGETFRQPLLAGPVRTGMNAHAGCTMIPKEAGSPCRVPPLGPELHLAGVILNANCLEDAAIFLTGRFTGVTGAAGCGLVVTPAGGAHWMGGSIRAASFRISAA